MSEKFDTVTEEIGTRRYGTSVDHGCTSDAKSRSLIQCPEEPKSEMV